LKALIARKIGMTQLFGEKGKLVPVTLLQAEPCTVTALRGEDKDGYSAAVIGYGKPKRLGKALKGQFKNAKTEHAYLREVRIENPPADSKEEQLEIKIGDKLTAAMFKAGDTVTVSGTSKGKGFAGTIKRYNFHRGPKTHGSKSYRAPGSIGSMYPQKIWKGKKMAGRMGQDKVSLRSVEVAEVDAEQNLLALKGSIPGAAKSIVVIKGL